VDIVDTLQSEPFQLYYRVLPSAIFYTDDLRNDSSDRPEFYLWPLFLPAALSIDKAARAAGRPQRIPTCRRKLSAAQSRDELELLYIIVGK